MIRFLHTADLQLGKPFNWAKGVASKLTDKRGEAVERLARAASEQAADFVVVAGDLFDANTVDDRLVVRTCERLKQFSMPVFILPGNHDCGGGPDSVYRRQTWQRHKPDHVEVLDERAPRVVCDGEAVILPAPLYEQNTFDDPTSHLTADFGRDEAPDAIRVGLAHGGVVDFDKGEGQNVIPKDRAERAGLDYLALGDWHGGKEVGPRTWFSGTPEPDRFKSNDPGYALVVEIDAPGARPSVESLAVASTVWLRHSARLSDAGDVDKLAAWFDALERPLDTLVRLEYGGMLSLTDIERLERLLEDMSHKLFYLRRRDLDDGIVPRPSDDELADIAVEGYFKAAVDELVDTMQGVEADGERAGRALEFLYRLKMGEGGA
jgi:DNA repair exonuclease SbcCD nuclease subunit